MAFLGCGWSLADNTLGKKKVFGVELRWESENAEADTILTKKIEQYQSEFTQSMDPDCRWRKPVNGICENNFPEQTKELEKIAEVIKKETLGVYEILHKGKDGIVRRDFDGLSQGFFINRLKGEIKLPWMADFAGDIFVHPLIKPTKNLIVGDPLIEAVTYATVDMPGGGWMIASAGRALGAKLRNPNQTKEEEAPKEDFQKIIVFAEPNFDGARVDAWATAIVAGGKPVLEHLWTLKDYEGKWGYFGLTSESKPVWSNNLKFRERDGVRTVIVPAWK
jgi:hypothetical protein